MSIDYNKGANKYFEIRQHKKGKDGEKHVTDLLGKCSPGIGKGNCRNFESPYGSINHDYLSR